MSIYMENGVREGLDHVLNLGRQDNNEHLSIIRDGKTIHTFDGEHDRVELSDGKDLFKQGDILVHNHPGALNGLSNMDFFATAQVRADWIYAITNDGSIYKGRLKTNPFELGRLANAYPMMAFENSYYKLLNEVVIPPEFSERIHLNHWVALRMQSLGVIDYEYELGPETTELVSKINSINHV